MTRTYQYIDIFHFSVDHHNYTKAWQENINYNIRRLSKLLVRGKIDRIIFPDKRHGENNLQRLVRHGKDIVNNALTQTLNITFKEIINVVLDAPEEITNNMACLAPRVALFARLNQRDNTSPKLRRRIYKQLSKRPGTL